MDRRRCRRNEIDAVGVDFDDFRALRFQPFDHLLEQIAPDLGDTRGGFEVGEVSLRKTEIAVETVDQNLEGVLQGMEVAPLRCVLGVTHIALRLEAKGTQVGEEMAKDLELIVHRKAIELEHDRRIERSDVAMPDVARHAGEKDVGVTALKPAHHRHLGNAVALPEILAEEKGVDPGGVAAHDHVLIVVGKNLGLDEVAGTQEIGHGARLAHRAEGAFAVTFRVILPGALQFLAGKLRNVERIR